MEERRVKGTMVIGLLKYVKRKWGNKGLEEAMKYSGILQIPRSGEWVDLDTMYRVLEWINSKYGESYVLDAGKSVPRYIVGDIKYMFASLMKFEKILKNVPNEISALLFKGGMVTVEKIGDRKADITVRNVDTKSQGCKFWKGALLGIMEMTKTSGEVQEITPNEKYDCKFDVKWT